MNFVSRMAWCVQEYTVLVTCFLDVGTQEGALSLELALASERGKWYEENRRAWQKQQQLLLSTAHREWSRAQEAVTKAEVERARKQWEEKQGSMVQVGWLASA